MTANDLKTKTCKTIALCISNETNIPGNTKVANNTILGFKNSNDLKTETW